MEASPLQIGNAVITLLGLLGIAIICLQLVKLIREIWFVKPVVAIKENGKSIVVNVEGTVTRAEHNELYEYAHDRIHEVRNMMQQMVSRMEIIETTQATILAAIVKRNDTV